MLPHMISDMLAELSHVTIDEVGQPSQYFYGHFCPRKPLQTRPDALMAKQRVLGGVH